MKKISILGCGWLGFPLAESLLKEGFSVNGSTTSIDKLSVIEKSRIQAYLISLSDHGTEGDIFSFLENSEILIIDIPPKLRGIEKENFVAKIEILIPFIEESSVKKVLFISSTSVYPDDDDNTNSIITEDTKPQPDYESGRQLLAAELLLQNNKKFKTTVLRFGGLIGNDRHPIFYLAGRKGISNPTAPINLIHKKDCISIILKIIEKDCWDEVFNAVAPYHPKREDYYTQKAVELNLAFPEFNFSTSGGKVIDSGKLEKMVGYEFQEKRL